jgi:putative radical SAM enzyme (TIGR03279 family)
MSAIGRASPDERPGQDPSTRGAIAWVDPDGTGAEIGLRPGDEVVAIDGHPLRDEVDYRYAVAEERVVLLVRNSDGAIREIEVEKDIDDALGIAFREPLFDGVRECDNRCIFCFVDQMPPDARATTRIYDDDYRLSFLNGNFVTLTNLSGGDVARILSQRLSPLYVSVHATDPAVRRRLFRSPHAERGMEVLRELVAGGITVHAQIVLVPGRNDGAVLEGTVADLAALHPGVASVAVVPVGLTAHREGLPRVAPVSGALAREVLDSIGAWRVGFLSRLGTRFCFAADELYVLAERPFPAARDYEDYPQVENGVGLCVPFVAELRRALKGISAPRPTAGRVTVLTGRSAAPVLERVLTAAGILGPVAVRALANTYLGESVTVAGLLAGRDVMGAAREIEGPLAVVPAVALSDHGEFIDGVSLPEAENAARAANHQLVLADGARELAAIIRRGLAEA